jgi:hypothetical protein
MNGMDLRMLIARIGAGSSKEVEEKLRLTLDRDERFRKMGLYYKDELD